MNNSIADHLLNTPGSCRQLLCMAGSGGVTVGMAMVGLPAQVTEYDNLAKFERLNNLIHTVQETAKDNPDLAGVRAISAWYKTQPLGKLSGDDQVAVTGALVLTALDQLTKSMLNPEGVRTGLGLTIYLNGFNAEYLTELAEQTQALMKADPAYAERVKKAYEQVALAGMRCTAPQWTYRVVIAVLLVLVFL